MNKQCILSLITGLILIANSTAQSQSIERVIKWNGTSTSYRSQQGKAIRMLQCEGSIAMPNDGYLPHYAEQIPISNLGEATAILSNEVYETVSSPDFNIDSIPTSIKVNTHVGMMRKRSIATINLVPLKRNAATGQVEKLVKFTLRLEVQASKQGRSTDNFANSSVLASGTWYKAGITIDGVYKLDYNYLKNTAKIDVANVSFSTLAVYGNGAGMVPTLNATPRPDDLLENPTMIVDNNGNNKIDNDDYLLFYAQGPDKWSYNSTTNGFDFEKNLFADTNYYFITPDRGTGKRITSLPGASNPTKTITQFDDHYAHQQDKYNLISSGRQWYGDRMSSLNPSVDIPVSFPNIITSSPVTITSSIYTNNSGAMQVSLAGQVVLNHGPIMLSGSFIAPGSSFNMTYTYTPSDPAAGSNGYIEYMTLVAQRSLTFTSGAMPFRSLASIGTGVVSQFNITNASSGVHVWDVTDISAIAELSGSNSGGMFSFTTPTTTFREFVAVDVNASYTNPIGAEKIDNQNLHAIGQPTYIIVAPDELLTAANDLAAFHSQRDGMKVKVVKLKEVFNEFGGGKHDIAAIRDMTRMVYERAGSDTSKLPKYLLLFGDGSFDPKDRTPDNNNQMPTYQSRYSQSIENSYTSDDYFACLDPNEGGDIDNPQLMDIAIGRLPAADATEAQGMVNKIKLYKSPTALGSWRSIVSYVSDEPFDYPLEFESSVKGFADVIRQRFPVYNIDQLITDAYAGVPASGGLRYPDMNTAILNRINLGTLVMSYTGHGGVSNWSNGRIFNLSDIQQLQNHEKLPLMVTATCDFSRFDDPSKKTAGEFLMTNANGGAIAMFTTVRPVYLDGNDALQGAFDPFIYSPYNGTTPTVGEILLNGKNIIISTKPYYTVNSRQFSMLGDPAMKLNYPEYNIVTTAIDSVPVSQPHDTLKALKYVTISGEVRDVNGTRVTGFNGTCYPLVYDKIGQFKTLSNKPNYGVMAFDAYKNSLFKGQCTVTNGRFSFSFIVPKDINYAIGKGRISYYADNGSRDGHGYDNDITVGGASDSALSDKDGPKIKLYMNNEQFVYGGITDESPKLLAKVEDASGINATGNGLGHDITCIVDANSKSPVVLNEYYRSELNSFKKGKVLYPFTKLTEGRHTLKVKVWDILNNSSEDNTEFVVASSAKLALAHVYNYPNPFTTSTQFMFEHNRPGDQLKIQVQIYSIAGHLIKTLQEDLISDGYRVNNLRWDGLDDYGDKIGKGVYVYKVHVKDSQGATADKFEKLVVLR